MIRPLLLSLLLAWTASAEPDGGVDDARRLMKEGLERDLQKPTSAPQWPTTQAPPQREAERVERLDLRARGEAALRARSAAQGEERGAPETSPAGSQARTNAAKATSRTTPRPTPPRP